MTTSFLFPGAIQYYGPTEVCDQPTKTLKLEASGAKAKKPAKPAAKAKAPAKAPKSKAKK